MNLVCAVCLQEIFARLKQTFPDGIPMDEVYRAFDHASSARSTNDHGKALCLKHWCQAYGVKRKNE